jgi:hypothetical protein
MTDATKATPLSADIQPKIGEYTSPGVQTPPPAIPQDQLTGKTHGRNPSRAREVKAVAGSYVDLRQAPDPGNQASEAPRRRNCELRPRDRPALIREND